METTFIYNKFVTGKNFVGRKGDSSILANLLSAGENVSIYEPPKSGKMSLVEQTLFNMRIQGKRFTVAQVDLLNIRTIQSLLLRIGSTLIRSVATTPGEYADIASHHLAGTHFVFDPEAYSERDEVVSLNWDIDDSDIAAILRLPYRLAESSEGCLFVIFREFQNIEYTEDGDRVLRLFERVIKEESSSSSRCSFIFTGSQLNAMKEIFEHRHFFYRQVEHLPLQRVDEKEIVDHIIRGFLSSGKVIDRDLLFGVCKLFDNNLWYINHFISICDSLSKGYIMEPVLLEALDMLLSIHEPRFMATMNDLTTFQVNLLHAIVDGHTKFSSAEVIAQYSLNSSANVRRLKDALCKKEIISFDEKDEPHILDPLFEYWVKKYYFGINVAL